MKAGNISCVNVTVASCQRETKSVFCAQLDLDANIRL